MKKKIIVMGICILLLIVIFVGNIFKRVNQDKDKQKTNQELILRVGDMMTIPESIRLLGYLGIKEEELQKIINVTLDNWSEKSETYDKDNINTNQNYLCFEDCLSLLDLVCTKLEVKSDAITSKLTFDIKTEPGNKIILTNEFLNLYESILASLPADTAPVVEKNMFVLGSPNNEDDTVNNDTVMVTDQGDYSYKNAASYDRLYTNEDQDSTFHLEYYIDNKISAMVCGNDIVYVKAVLNEETILHNVWIVKGIDGTVSTFLYNISRDFSAKYKLTDKIEGKIGDLTIQDKKIVKISIKPDIIGGKVLVADKKYIEIDGYGRIFLDDNYKIYKTYDELSMEETNSILVGYDTTDFVVANGKIVAALIKNTIKADNIRVLIKTNKFENIFHQEVTVTATRNFTVTVGDKKKNYKKGEKVTFSAKEEYLSKERVTIKTNSESGKIKLLSLNRSYGNPSYRGSIEIASTNNGLIIINELSIEEYLYAVIPSEMPTYYGLEALKVQAICARSYAYNQLFANGYSEYGAHVDDSVTYQVYNNIAEDKNSILAVKDTYGKVIKYNDSVITAYYFSTSCGHTASLEEVWSNYGSVDYLIGKLQKVEENVSDNTISASSKTQNTKDNDFSTETVFRNFILKPTETTYDSEYPWYRWKVTISLKNLKETIDKSLSQRYNSNPELIKTLVGKDKYDESQYQSLPIDTIGTVRSILIGKREESGILSEIIIVGSEHTIKVKTEYNIRCLLAPIQDDVTRQDDSVASGLSMLPSAYFIMDKDGKEITFQGGGYGHGVGMSQNGAKTMADLGKECEEIIKHYYTGVEIGFIY